MIALLRLQILILCANPNQGLSEQLGLWATFYCLVEGYTCAWGVRPIGGRESYIVTTPLCCTDVKVCSTK